MAAVDAYSPCPCGSGQKYKWCCQKVEAVAERAHRLYRNGQLEAAIHALDEGLRKEPGSAWLLTRKAMYLVGLEQYEAAKAPLREVLEKQPHHAGAHLVLCQLVLATEGPSAGVAQFQQALSATPSSERATLAVVASTLGLALARHDQYPAALRHLVLAEAIRSPDEPAGTQVKTLERDRTVSLWLRNWYIPEPPPAGLPDESRDRFAQALGWADEGLWSAAASAFEVLSAEKGQAAGAADRNLGLCRLWLADEDGAVPPLRRAIARMGDTDEAVDLEALCQAVENAGPDDIVEQVQLSWPLRDRDRLLGALRDDRSIAEEGPGPIDLEDPDSAEVIRFGLLDRPKLEKAEGLRIEDMPRFVGRAFVGEDVAGIETVDDGRLDGLVERFTELAKGAIPPAHPKTKVIDKVTRTMLALSWEWHHPDHVPPAELRRLEREQGKWVFEEVWPKTPMPYLDGRTPLEAAKAGDAVVPLRAAVLQQELSRDEWSRSIDFAAVRARLGLGPEPAIDPATVDVDGVHISRIQYIPADRLDDERLAKLYRRARTFGVDDAIESAARALVERPQAWQQPGINSLVVHADLALLAVAHGRTAEAFDWVARGRQSDSPEERLEHAPFWDMVEIRIRTRTQPPEEWVPELAVVLERYPEHPTAGETITLALLELGLIRMVPNPDDPDDLLLDTRPLQIVLSRYGPRVTTASGSLGVAATRGIWTPGGTSAGGGAGIWTPGSEAGSPPAGEPKPKLIIPGR